MKRKPHSKSSRPGRGLAATLLYAALCVAGSEAQEITESQQCGGIFALAVTQYNVTLNARDAALEQVLNELGAEANVRVLVHDDLPETVSLSLSQVSVQQAFRRLLDGRSSVLLYEPDVADGNKQLAEVHVYARQPATTTAESLEVTLDEAIAASPTTPDKQQAVADGNNSESPSNAPTEDTSQHLEALRRVLASAEDPAERLRAATDLYFLGGEDAIHGLGAGVSDEDETVRLEVIDSLGGLDRQNSSLLLAQIMLGDPNPRFRLQATRALVNHSPVYVVDFLNYVARTDLHGDIRLEAATLREVWLEAQNE